MDYDVIVIGGGASGMMAAGVAAERGRRVLLLERNSELGVKLKITGGGRCNITNAERDEYKLLEHYGAAKPFLHSPFSQFGVEQTFTFFEQRGLSLVEQAHRRVFPKTERAPDVCAVLERYLRDGNVDVRTSVNVQRLEAQGGSIVAVVVDGERIAAASYILATGGTSHPETGSTGDGFLWLAELGHTINEPTPTIVPLAVADWWVASLAGTTLPNARISFLVDGVRQFSKQGDILCTHFGLSGPLILNAAASVADLLHTGMVTATIDVAPQEDIGATDRRITAVFDANKNKTLKNVWNDIAPIGTGAALLPLLPGIAPDTKVHSVTKEQRRAIVDLLKTLPVTITGLMGFDRAVEADGGLVLDEVDTRTMRSKKYSNLYVTGDILHIRRPSGGYSLQLCWTTGFVAGTNA